MKRAIALVALSLLPLGTSCARGSDDPASAGDQPAQAGASGSGGAAGQAGAGQAGSGQSGSSPAGSGGSAGGAAHGGGGMPAHDGGYAVCSDGGAPPPSTEACSPGAIDEQACGCDGGSRKRTCSAAGSWGPYGTCSKPGYCVPCETKTEACGRCGHRASYCDPNACGWVSGQCVDQGSCSPGEYTTDEAGCSGGQVTVSLCGDDCQMHAKEGCIDPPGWRSLADAPFPPRARAQVVLAGNTLVVWGGQPPSESGHTDSGGRLDLAQGAWSPIAPSGIEPRSGASAVFTGTHVLVWGGEGDEGKPLKSGGLYDVSKDSWTPTSLTGAAGSRLAHVTVWTGSEMFVWGGKGLAKGHLATGGRYDPGADSWKPVSPSPLAGRYGHAAVWDPDHARVIVWGGVPDGVDHADDSGALYDPATDSWSPMAPCPLGGRAFHLAAWDDTKKAMIVWGGQDAVGNNTSSTLRYDAGADAWSTLEDSQSVGFAGREGAAALFASGALWVVGGGTVFGPNAGAAARLDAATGAWRALPAMHQGRKDLALVWAAAPLVFGGGVADPKVLSSAERLDAIP